MAIDVTKENLRINRIVGQKTEMIVVEGDIIVPDIKPDILNTINTTGNVCIYKKEVLEEKIRMDGNVNLYIMYLADNAEEATRSLSTSIDFTQIMDFDGCSSNMSLEEQVGIKTIECKVLNGRKISVKVTLQVEARVYANESIDMIKKINALTDVQFLDSNLVINSLIGEGNSKTYAKDTILIDNIDNLAEILKVDLAIVNKDIKISYNKVLGKADLAVKMMYLTEDNRIRVVENKIAIMGFVDMDAIKEEDLCDMRYQLKNVIIKPNAVEEHSIYVEAEIELNCRVYENRPIQVIQDLYSPSQDICFNKRCINTMAQKNETRDICNIREKIAIPDINGNQIYDVEVRPVIYSKTIINSKVVVEGEVELNFIYASGNVARIDTRQCKLPLEFSIDMPDINANTNIDIEIEIRNQDFVVGTDGYIDAKLDLEFHVKVSSTIEISVIDEITVDETRQREIYSMIIYFVKQGDTLWSIAKKFKSTVEDIARVNKIENENKIYPGQQLFIPKYTCTKREMSA